MTQKKNLIFKTFFFFSFFLSCSTYAQQISFDNHITVSSGTDGFGRPRIVLVNDNPLIIFRNNTSPKTIKLSKWNGVGFDTAYNITNVGVDPSSQDGPEIAVYGDTIYVVFSSSATMYSSIMMIRSFDGGITFSDTMRVSENNVTQIFRMGNVTVDNLGNPIISYMSYTTFFTNPKQIVRTSSDFGTTFNTAVVASANASAEPCECCKSSVIAKDNKIFLLFRVNDNNIRNSHIAMSDNNGLSFDAVNDIDDYNWILNNCPASITNGVFYGDSILIVKKSGATGNNEVVITSVSQTSLDYSYNRNIDDIVGVEQRYPEIVNNGDSIFIVWEDNRSGVQNCFLSYSTNGISDISTGLSFTDSTNSGPKFLPHLAFNNGKLHLVYIDYLQSSIKYVKGYFVNPTYINQYIYENNNNLNFDFLGRNNNNSILKFILKNKNTR
tara:strand:+ start:107 stop:1423 length:1317 start_codon:yes stop_codon:yes gene_type:complete